MEEKLEKKVDALLDEKEQTEEEAQEEEKKQEVKDPGEILREISRGKLKLLHPFRAHSEDVNEIAFDFCGLTGNELMDALDSVPANNMFAITNAQALAIFAATAEKCAPMVQSGERMTRLYDAKDVKRGLGAADTVKVVQLAKLFYNASSQAGNSNISKE